MLKLHMHHLGLNADEELVVTTSTPDGQSKSAALKKMSVDDSMDFWVDSNNWFGDLTVVIHREGEEEQSISLEPLSLINFGTKGRGIVSTYVYVMSWNLNSTSTMETTNVEIHHEFLEAGQVRVESIELDNLPSDAVGSQSNLRLILRSKGKTHRNESMTAPPTISDSKLLWNSPLISLPVVDEYTMLIECYEYDEIANDQEEVGIGEISLLPLFRDGSIETTVNMKHLTEVSS
jgi:hypothetical protein